MHSSVRDTFDRKTAAASSSSSSSSYIKVAAIFLAFQVYRHSAASSMVSCVEEKFPVMKRVKIRFLIIVVITVLIICHQSASIPVGNATTATTRPLPKYVEINLPVKITTLKDLVEWIQNAMDSKASKIDVNLATPAKSVDLVKKLAKLENALRKPKIKSDTIPSPRNGFIIDIDMDSSPWLKRENEISIINPDTFLPALIIKKAETTTVLPRLIKTNNTTVAPFAVPFEAFITITRHPSSSSSSSSSSTDEELTINRDEFLPYLMMDNVTRNMSKKQKIKAPERKRKRQMELLGDILKMLGLIRNVVTKPRSHQAAAAAASSRQLMFGDSRRMNETSQRQEFDDDEDYDDDDDDEEQGGSLGSIADLLPLALPILEDLSDPESETNLIELIQAGVPLIAGLFEGDEDGEGGANELIQMITQIVTKIVNDGEGSDLGALVAPIFGLLAPFIGPVLGPVIGPLIRTISNPPTEGSSLPVLLNAIVGPLTQPQEPSGMSPLSIIIAGTTAALLKELKPGAPGGSDLGALIGAILSGVLAGTSAGLSGPLSGTSSSNGGHPEYGANLQVRPASFIRPSSSSSSSSSSSNIASTVNIGSTLRPSHQFISQRPGPLMPSYVTINHALVPAAATNDINGGSSYLPYAAAVPANSVNPIALIGTTVKEILGAGIQVVSSLVNAVFGVSGASSQEQPKPSYGPPPPHQASSAPYTQHHQGALG